MPIKVRTVECPLDLATATSLVMLKRKVLVEKSKVRGLDFRMF